MQVRSEKSDDMNAIAADFVASLKPGEQATVVTLSGELGAGKTTFTQCVARSLGVIETVTSPTFVLEKIYTLESVPFKRLIHIDAYRLKEVSEIDVLGWDEIIAEPGNLILLEWPERVPGRIPESAVSLTFDIDGEARIITITYGKESSQESREKDSR